MAESGGNRLKIKKQDRKRTLVQLVWVALTNGYVAGFLSGKIYKGAGKQICVPGLNCYSCPGALGSCPIGAWQSVAADRSFSVSLYIAGFLMIVGALCGRLICGFLCPFGLVQDLLYKIPVVRKIQRVPGDRYLRWLKYVILGLFVILLPIFVADAFGIGQPWFCKYICPSGTLMAGWPLVLMDEALGGLTGFLFAWKSAILIVLLLLSVVLYRPFCRYLCPLGAVYGCFNGVALLRFRVDREKCTRCGSCQKACKMDIPVWEKPNSPECIRCGACLKACPEGALCHSRPGGAGEREVQNHG